MLCVRLDALGDVLMTTPALRALKQSHPGRRLTLLTSSIAAELAPLVPEIDDCIVYDAPWMKASASRTDSRPDFAVIERLRAAELLASTHDLPIVFSGSSAESEWIENIRAAIHSSSHSLAGRLSLAELVALISRAPVLISNNTGPAHIAAAVGTPVVDLYAQTNPQHTPWLTRHRLLYHDVPCKNCFKRDCPEGHHDCLARVPPEAVARAALELLTSSQRPQVRALRAVKE